MHSFIWHLRVPTKVAYFSLIEEIILYWPAMQEKNEYATTAPVS